MNYSSFEQLRARAACLAAVDASAKVVSIVCCISDEFAV
jgi:hypothetical protein